MFNINKYQNDRFSKDKSLDDKIKALYLLFDKRVEDLKLNKRETISSINLWIKIFIDKEEYELADAFKKRKISEWRKNRKVKRFISARLFYRVWRRRIKKIIFLFFNKKSKK